jgi:hypothetical protein
VNRLDAAIRAKFGEDISYVKRRRPFGHAEPGGDLQRKPDINFNTSSRASTAASVALRGTD